MSDIKRKTEIYLVTVMKAAIPTLDWFPMTGFDTNSEELEPPLGVVSVSGAIKEYDQIEVYTLTGTVQVITHSQDTTSEDHAKLVRAAYEAIVQTPVVSQCDFILHGLSVTGQRYSLDTVTEARADLIDFTCGASG